MFSRREALKLGTVGLFAPALGANSLSPTNAMQLAQPDWPMQGGNPARTGVMTGSGPNLDKPLVAKWSWSGQFWSIPVVQNGTMYFSPDNLSGLYAVDFETGIQHWSAIQGQGVGSQIVHEGSVFAVVDSEYLYAFDAGTGQQLWQKHVQANPSDSLVAIGDTLYCRFGSSGILALDTSTGEERWFYATPIDDSSTISAREDTIYFHSAASILHAIDASTGLNRWSIEITDPDQYGQGEGTIIVLDDMLCVRDKTGVVHGIDQETGNQLWRTPIGDAYEVVCAKDGRIYGFTYNLGAFALDSSSGQVVWSFYNEYSLEVSGIYEDTLLVHGMAGRNTPWRVFGLDANTGEPRWSYQSHYRTYGPIVAGDHFLMYGLSGYVIGNPRLAKLQDDVVLRGAPAATGIERGTASAGDEIDSIGAQDTSTGASWVQITIGEVSGWIPLDAIDPESLPTNTTTEDQGHFLVEFY